MRRGLYLSATATAISCLRLLNSFPSHDIFQSMMTSLLISGENLAMQRENEGNPNSALTLSESVTGINVNANVNSNSNSIGSINASSSASPAKEATWTLLTTARAAACLIFALMRWCRRNPPFVQRLWWNQQETYQRKTDDHSNKSMLKRQMMTSVAMSVS